MDERYYILGGLALLLLVLLFYLLYALGRYRKAVRRAREARRAAAKEAEARYLVPEAESASDVFSVRAVTDRPAGAIAQPAPRRELHIPEVHPQVPGGIADGFQSIALEGPLAPDATIDEPSSPPMAAAVAAEPVYESLPEPEPAPAPAPEMLPGTLPPPGPASAPAPAEPAPLLGAAPWLEEAFATAIEPSPEPEVTLTIEPEPSLEYVTIPAPEPISAPTSEPTPVPTPMPEPVPEPTPVPRPVQPPAGYSLADDLERLMAAATEASPLLSPHEHADVVTPPRIQEPVASFEAPPLVPPPSVGQVLSSAPPTLAPAPVAPPAPTPAPVASPAPTPAPVASPAPAPTPPAPPADPARAEVPEYVLVAPVELHFTTGPGRIGVKQGTRSYQEFQRLAGILLGDLHATRGR